MAIYWKCNRLEVILWLFVVTVGQLAQAGLIHWSNQCVQTEVGEPCQNHKQILMSLFAEEVFNIELGEVRVSITRAPTKIHVPLAFYSVTSPKKEIFVPSDHCGVYWEPGSCIDLVGANRTLCCNVHPSDGRLYRGQGEHCLGMQSDTKYQVYSTYDPYVDIRSTAVISTVVNREVVEYRVEWTNLSRPPMISGVFSSKYSVNVEVANLLNVFLFFEAPGPLVPDTDLTSIHWFPSRQESNWDRLFMSPDEWISHAHCLQPHHYLTRTQLEAPEDQYTILRTSKLQDYFFYPLSDFQLDKTPRHPLELSFIMKGRDIAIIELLVISSNI